MTRRRIVLDTDMASDVDDALCLALAVASPEIELVAVTVVGRESRLRAQVTRKLLELAGAPEVPVFAGCRVPLLAGGGFNWYGHEGEGILEPGEEPHVEPEHAVDALERLLHEHDDLELVAIGPLTNLAVALIKDPDLAGRPARLSVMGGHLRRVSYGGHEFAPGVDYNLCSDPHASCVVLRAGMPTQLVTADVTLETWITEGDLERIEAGGTPLHCALAKATRIWAPVWKRAWRRRGCAVGEDHVAFLHDPLTLASAYDDSFCGFEHIEVETTIRDGVLRTLPHPRPVEGTAPLRCATSVDAPRFREFFVERVRGLGGAAGRAKPSPAHPAPGSPEGDA